MDKIKTETVLSYLSIIYRMVLRDLLIKTVNDPNSEWDDKLIKVLDGLLMDP